MRVTIDQVIKAVKADDCRGFCIACGEEAFGVEPDAREYECEVCNERKVYGAAELLMTMDINAVQIGYRRTNHEKPETRRQQNRRV